MKLGCTVVFVCFNYSTGFSNDDFSLERLSLTLRGLTANGKDDLLYHIKIEYVSYYSPQIQIFSLYCSKS